MLDFRVVQARSFLPIIAVVPIRDFLPASVLVTGERFRLVQEVSYNGMVAPDFIVQSDSRLIVQIPLSQVGKDLADLRVISSVRLAGGSAAIELALAKPPQTVDGIDRLIQNFVMVLFSTKGSDIWDQSSGGGLLGLVGQVSGSGRDVTADFTLSVEGTVRELIQKQALDPRIPLAERLLSASIQGLQFDEKSTTLMSRVEIRNMLNERGEIGVSSGLS